MTVVGVNMTDIVALRVTHSELKSFCAELRFGLDRRVGDVKGQLAMKCGTEPAAMRLVLKDDAETTLYNALEDDHPLGYYSPYDGYGLHIVDLNPSSSNAWLEDLSQVEKYTMPDEEYDKLEDSFRAFKRRMGNSKASKTEPLEAVDIKCDINVGDRCQVDPGEKRGTVRFVGSVSQLKSGIWIGIEYDEPVGKNDGSLEGIPYFSCSQPYGAFVRATRVRVGDYPPIDDFDDEL